MRDIFERCSRVLIWLGEEEGETDSEMAMDLAQAVYISFHDYVSNDSDNGEASKAYQDLENIVDVSPSDGFSKEELTHGSRKMAEAYGLWLKHRDQQVFSQIQDEYFPVIGKRYQTRSVGSPNTLLLKLSLVLPKRTSEHCSSIAFPKVRRVFSNFSGFLPKSPCAT